jgi:hypothetical protein
VSGRSVHTPECGKLKPLAERARDRLLCRCTCGALHLVWENATVQLRAHDLCTLLHALDLGHIAPFRVRREDAETVQVWLYNTGLRLSAEGLATFRGLIAEADEALRKLELRIPGTEPSPVRSLN